MYSFCAISFGKDGKEPLFESNTNIFIDLIKWYPILADDFANMFLSKFGFNIGSPENSEYRGSHVSLCHPESFRINKALIDSGIIPDFRAPDSIRIGITPLYTTYLDIYKTIDRMCDIMENKLYEKYSFEKGKVT